MSLRPSEPLTMSSRSSGIDVGTTVRRKGASYCTGAGSWSLLSPPCSSLTRSAACVTGSAMGWSKPSVATSASVRLWPAEGNDLGVALAVERRRHDRHDGADVDAVGEAVRHVEGRYRHRDVERETELHDVVLEIRDPHLRAVAAEERVAAGEVDVLV